METDLAQCFNRQQLHAHRDSLLTAGVPYRQVRRHTIQLQDHFQDLYSEGVQRGLSAEAAAQWACEQLGSLEQIHSAMLTACPSRSWFSRYPKLMTMLAPVLLHIAILVTLLLIAGAGLELLKPEGDAAFYLTAETAWVEDVYLTLRFILMFLITPLLSLGLAVLSIRQKIAVSHWATGIFILCLVTSSLVIHLSFPDPVTGEEGILGASVGYAFWVSNSNLPHFLSTTGRLLLNLLLAYCTGWLLLRRQHKADAGFVL